MGAPWGLTSGDGATFGNGLVIGGGLFGPNGLGFALLRSATAGASFQPPSVRFGGGGAGAGGWVAWKLRGGGYIDACGPGCVCAYGPDGE